MSIGQVEKINLTKHLAVMIRSGITLTEAFENLIDQAKNRSTKSILTSINNNLKNGSSLSSSLEKHPKIFNEFYRGIIAVGESTGKLDSSLDYLSQQLSMEYALGRKVQGALMYPALVFLATIGLSAFVSLYILPKLVDFFSAFETKLPLATLVLFRTSVFMKSYGIYVFGSFFAFILITSVFVQLPNIKPYWHSFLLSIPLFGTLLKKKEVSQFCRNFGILIRSGLPVYEALAVVEKTQSNIVYQRVTHSVAENLEKGQGIAEVLRRSQIKKHFPRLVADMISVGEKTGKIDDSLLYVSQFYDEDIEDTAKNLTNILEPAVLLFIGLIVAFVALAIISPIYELTGAIGS